MVWAISRRFNISNLQKSAEGIIVQAVRSEEVLVHVVTGSCPEVANLLWADVATIVRRALKGWGRHLENGKRRCIGGERLCHAWDGWNERWGILNAVEREI
jgi:hypothetical protein